jgi:tRNA-dihydrouridine synthase B
MVDCSSLVYASDRGQLMLRRDADEDFLGVQLVGAIPEHLKIAAEKLNDHDFSLLDLNLGCPVPKVVRNGDGSALMQDPDLVHDVVAAAVRGSSKPVTVKIRKGFTDDRINAAEVARAAEAGGASAVAVHGRTRPQYYSGKADWDIIREVREAVGITVIGNGDIFTGEDGIRMLEETGCDLVMVGRGAIGNPWIFRDLRRALEGLEPVPAPSGREKTAMMIRHLEMLVQLKGETTGVREFRKFVVHYTKGLRGSARVRREVNDADTIERMKEILEREDW